MLDWVGSRSGLPGRSRLRGGLPGPHVAYQVRRQCARTYGSSCDERLASYLVEAGPPPVHTLSSPHRQPRSSQEVSMNLHLTIGPIVSLIAGILILVVPRLLNYIVAIYLILIGLMGLLGSSNFHLT